MKRDRENLKRLIKEAGLESLENLILSYAYPSIRIYTEVIDETLLAIGESKIGGQPDLPDDYEWLYYSGDLSKLKRRDFPADIPPWEPPPARQGDRYRACKLSFVPEVNVDYELIEDLSYDTTTKIDDDAWDKLHDLVHQTDYSERPWVINRLLGINRGAVDCQLEANTGDRYSASVEAYEEARQNHSDWQHLLKIGSDQNADMMWHDAGDIAFFIRRSDLQNLKFDNICWTFETG